MNPSRFSIPAVLAWSCDPVAVSGLGEGPAWRWVEAHAMAPTNVATRGNVLLLRMSRESGESENPTLGRRAQGWVRYEELQLQLHPVQSARSALETRAPRLSAAAVRRVASGTVTVKTDPTPISLRTV